MPRANGVLRSPSIAVDWDGTCIESQWPSRSGVWLPGAVESLRLLVGQGYDTVIHTCRIAPVLSSGRERNGSSVVREVETIRRRLDEVGLDQVSIHTAPWKPNADVYLDDKAIRFTSWKEAMWTLAAGESWEVVS